MLRLPRALVTLVLPLLGVSAAAEPLPGPGGREQLLAATPGGRAHLPRMSGDTLVHYEYPPAGLFITRGSSPPRRLNDGVFPEIAFSGQVHGLAYVADRPERQALFARVDRQGQLMPGSEVRLSPGGTAAGDRVKIAWNPEQREWLVLWTVGPAVHGARISHEGTLRARLDLGAGQGMARPVWTGRSYLVAHDDQGPVLTQIDEDGRLTRRQLVRERVFGVGLAWDGRGTAVTYRRYGGLDNDEIVFRYLAPGADVPPLVLARSRPAARPPRGAGELQLAGGPRPSAPPRSLRPPSILVGEPILAWDGKMFVVAWDEGPGGRFDARLHTTRVTAAGRVWRAPSRLVPGEVHQGDGSFVVDLGAGAAPVIVYLEGDPNREHRIRRVTVP